MTKTICSVYFSKLVEIRRPSYQGVFNLPVVKKGEQPARLVIKDHYEVNEQPFIVGTRNNRPLKTRILIQGEDIAADLLAHWTAYHPDMTSQCAPGLWVMRDVVYLWDDDGKPLIDADERHATRPATTSERDSMFAEDLAAAYERQDVWIETAIRRGDIMAEDPKKVPWIPQYCRDAVDYSGRQRDWRRGLRDGDIKQCPYCTKSITSTAFKCPFCSEVVDAFGYAEFRARQEAAHQEALIQLTKEREMSRMLDEAELVLAEESRQKEARFAQAEREHQNNKALVAQQKIKKAQLAEEGDKLVAAAEARSARLAAERDAEESATRIIPAALQRDNAAFEATK